MTLGDFIMKLQLTFAVSLTLIIAGCAKPTVTKVSMAGDEGLSCAQLYNAYEETEMLKDAAKSEKGVTGSNVMRGLLFWPAIIGTNMNANEAIQAADSRAVHLKNVMRGKGCDMDKL